MKRQALLESHFAGEEAFVKYLTGGGASDIVDLDVSGERISVARSTLMTCDGSVLASKFNTQWKQDDGGDDSDTDSDDGGTLIEHSPYCFGKIIDHMRLKRMFPEDAENVPPPTVVSHERGNFERIVKYYFPGQEHFIFAGTK